MANGLLEVGGVMLAASERRLEVVSTNVANTSTPGFKKEVSFQDALSARDQAAALSGQSAPDARTFTEFSQGALRMTGKPLDLAVSGYGFFKLRAGDQFFYGRAGAFERSANGSVVDAQGMALQAAGGGDLVIAAGKVEILQDGTVLQDGAPAARIALAQPAHADLLQRAGAGLFLAPEDAMQDVAAPVVRSGMLEASNVGMADEMVEMMTALRQAETGARLVQLYDSLAGQSISTFGQGAK